MAGAISVRSRSKISIGGYSDIETMTIETSGQHQDRAWAVLDGALFEEKTFQRRSSEKVRTNHGYGARSGRPAPSSLTSRGRWRHGASRRIQGARHWCSTPFGVERAHTALRSRRGAWIWDGAAAARHSRAWEHGFIARASSRRQLDDWAVCAHGRSYLASAGRIHHSNGVEGIGNSLLHLASS